MAKSNSLIKYHIHEIFASIQGEGIWAGTPAIFIRLADCNLACKGCDTSFEVQSTQTAEEILQKLLRYKPLNTVIITGGEPTIQNLVPLLEKLNLFGYIVHLETNGILAIPEGFSWICISPKLKYKLPLKENLLKAHEIKMPIAQIEDIQKAENFRKETNDEAIIWWLHPWDGINTGTTKICIDYVIKTGNWYLSIQLHKYLNIL